VNICTSKPKSTLVDCGPISSPIKKRIACRRSSAKFSKTRTTKSRRTNSALTTKSTQKNALSLHHTKWAITSIAKKVHLIQPYPKAPSIKIILLFYLGEITILKSLDRTSESENPVKRTLQKRARICMHEVCKADTAA